MNQSFIWKTIQEPGPLISAAIHDGHRLREEVAGLMNLTADERLREEDPYTGEWTTIGNTRIIGLRSRFEVDLNRPREKAVYIKPEDAWGLNVYHVEPPSDVVCRSLAEYDAFYEEVHRIFSEIEAQFGFFVVFDLHTYNHMRGGPDKPPADPDQNPEVNIGTGTMDRAKWAPLVDRFISDLRNYDYNNRKLDVRENVKFKGGQLSRWTHQSFPDSGCSLSIEFKKFFMDEWTGSPDVQQLEQIRLALQSTVAGVQEELKILREKWSREI